MSWWGWVNVDLFLYLSLCQCNNRQSPSHKFTTFAAIPSKWASCPSSFTAPFIFALFWRFLILILGLRLTPPYPPSFTDNMEGEEGEGGEPGSERGLLTERDRWEGEDEGEDVGEEFSALDFIVFVVFRVFWREFLGGVARKGVEGYLDNGKGSVRIKERDWNDKEEQERDRRWSYGIKKWEEEARSTIRRKIVHSSSSDGKSGASCDWDERKCIHEEVLAVTRKKRR